MGKSSKKIKNERINLIRKQYDAFLEEDKKRRDRNEYILGKLDKMRSSMTIVPISTKASYQLEGNPCDFCMRPDNVTQKISVYDTYMSHIDRQKMASNIDESTVLKEISKNYILIPKRRHIADKDHAYRKEAIDDNDWKSKYNILYDLKKQEKEGHSDTGFQQNNEIDVHVGGEARENLESPTCNKQFSNFNQFDKAVPSKDFQLTNANIADSSPEKQVKNRNSKDITGNKISLDNPIMTSNDSFKVNDFQQKINANQVNNPVIPKINQLNQEYVTEKEKYNSDINEKNENYLTENIINLEINNSNITNQAENQENARLLHNKPTAEISKIAAGHSNGYDSLLENTLDVRSQEPNTNEFSEKNYRKQNTTKEKYTEEMQDLISRERVKLYKDMDNNAESQSFVKQATDNTIQIKNNQETKNNIPVIPAAPTERVELYDNSPESQIEPNQSNYDTTQHYEATEENITAALESTEQSESINHDSEINAFEAEQKEMFYSEQTGGDAYEYNQGDGNTEEYNAEAYQQNDQYPYYEGVQQDQEYANINEHEESTERYDPHYVQQYEGTYENQQSVDYENTNAYDEQQYQDGNYADQQQFENIVTYEPQQDNVSLYQPENVSNENDLQGNVLASEENQIYDQQMYSEIQDTPEHIEQQLITEEGYVENVPMNIGELQKENELDTEIFNNTTTPVESIADPKNS